MLHTPCLHKPKVTCLGLCSKTFSFQFHCSISVLRSNIQLPPRTDEMKFVVLEDVLGYTCKIGGLGFCVILNKSPHRLASRSLSNDFCPNPHPEGSVNTEENSNMKQGILAFIYCAMG